MLVAAQTPPERSARRIFTISGNFERSSGLPLKDPVVNPLGRKIFELRRQILSYFGSSEDPGLAPPCANDL